MAETAVMSVDVVVTVVSVTLCLGIVTAYLGILDSSVKVAALWVTMVWAVSSCALVEKAADVIQSQELVFVHWDELECIVTENVTRVIMAQTAYTLAIAGIMPHVTA